METTLQQKFPDIKTFVAQNGATTARFDITPQGFHAIIFTPAGTAYIDPYLRGNTSFYIVYWKKDFYEKKVQKLMVANVDLLSNMHNTLSVDTNQLIMGNIMD